MVIQGFNAMGGVPTGGALPVNLEAYIAANEGAGLGREVSYELRLEQYRKSQMRHIYWVER